MDGKRPTIASRHGMVAAAHPLAAQAGAKLLAIGGNAFDAAVASAAALSVVEPGLSGPAGLGVASCYIAAEQRLRTLDFAARAPGCVAGWCELARAHGRRKLHDIFAPAVALARDGHPLGGFAAACLQQAPAAVPERPCFADWRAACLGGSAEAARPGQVIRQPELARSFELIASEGPEHFYYGALGRKLVAHAQSLGGGLSMPDLGAVAAVWHEPATAEYRGLLLHLPPAAAGKLLAALRILDGFALTALPDDGAERLDTLWRALRMAAGAAANLSEPQLEALRARLRDPLPLEPAAAPGPAEPLTTSLAVLDRDGNAVCLSQGLGGLFGCGAVVPGIGLCLATLAGGPAEPGVARALAPAIATREGRPVLLLGAAGGDAASQPPVQVLVQHADFALPIQDAIEAPRVRLGAGRLVQAERRPPDAVAEALRERGHELAAEPAVQVGAVQAIAIDPATGVATGGADPRRDGYVAVP